MNNIINFAFLPLWTYKIKGILKNENRSRNIWIFFQEVLKIGLEQSFKKWNLLSTYHGKKNPLFIYCFVKFRSKNWLKFSKIFDYLSVSKMYRDLIVSESC